MCRFEQLRIPEIYIQYNNGKEDADEVLNSAKENPYRSIFAIDRDRLMYCGAFRRLSSKTQVFHSKIADNIRTRLTHTLEVVQIARTIVRELGLNEDLAEAIALGHDIGHTPFGHVGERTLNIFSKGEDKSQKANSKIQIPEKYFGFKHNLQSIRVLMEYSEDLMFSNFLLFGIREHSKKYWKEESDVAFYNRYNQCCSVIEDNEMYPAWSFEAYIVKWADEVAQRHHDIEDAYLQKIMSPSDIIKKLEPLKNIVKEKRYEGILNKFEILIQEADKTISNPNRNNFVHMLSSFIIDAYVTILIDEFRAVLTAFVSDKQIYTPEEFESAYLQIDHSYVEEKMLKFDNTGAEILEVDNKLKRDLKESILDSFEVQRMDGKGAYVIRRLVRAYISNPQQLPNNYINRIFETAKEMLTSDEFDRVKTFWKRKNIDIDRDIYSWKNYEYREALRKIMDTENDDLEIKQLIYPVILRIVFDYVAGMTDSFALKQYGELY